jgi:hypothetical protein
VQVREKVSRTRKHAFTSLLSASALQNGFISAGIYCRLDKETVFPSDRRSFAPREYLMKNKVGKEGKVPITSFAFLMARALTREASASFSVLLLPHLVLSQIAAMKSFMQISYMYLSPPCRPRPRLGFCQFDMMAELLCIDKRNCV